MGDKRAKFKPKKRKGQTVENMKKAREAKRIKRSQKENFCEMALNTDNVETSAQGKTVGLLTPLSNIIHENHMEATSTETSNAVRTNMGLEQVDTNSSKENDMDDTSSEKSSMDIQAEITEFAIENEVPCPAGFSIEGRRIVDFQYFFEKLKSISEHNPAFGCTISNLEIVKEIRVGLQSNFVFKCNMCNSNFTIQNTDNSVDCMDLNNGAVMGALMIGSGKSNMNEFLASMNLPIMSQKTYAKRHDEQAKWWQAAAENSMIEAAKEEATEAIKRGDIKNGIPLITVVADCCWSKRSYKTNYSASSGVAAIIGYKTGKVLYMDVKNKYCIICAKAAVKSQPPVPHDCQKNHSGSSTSMEQAVIVEGFKTSIATRNLIYGTLIADGDASTYKKILESRPYANLQVEKIECSNHLLRNYCGKLLNITKNTAIPLAERKLLTADRIQRLRTAIKSAARFRQAQNVPTAEQIINLKKDILNGPRHVFGDHKECETYYCSDSRKQEFNNVPNLKTLFNKVMENTTHIALHSKSLLHNVNNNRAEQFNSIVAKLVGGKRINFSLKNSYTARCHAAVVSFNTARPQYVIYKSQFGKSPGKSLKRLEQARFNKKQKAKPRRLFKKKLIRNTDKGNYGEECQKPDMSEEDYETSKNTFLNSLKEQVNNRHEIERDTVLQAESALWLELRRCLLTASSFSKVCKRRPNTSSAPLVKSLLYSYSLQNVPSIQHGKRNEKDALKQLAVQEQITIQKCGLFVDDTSFFLGATPDGIFDEGIVEIKCPSSAYGIDPEEAVKQKLVKFWKADGIVNQRHDWFYQIQGQLHISKHDMCLFAIWTGKDFPLKVERIIRDDSFWNLHMEPKLISFYNSCLLREILDPRKSRSMPIRDTRY